MDRVIFIGCLLLVFTGLIIGLNINAAGSLLSSLSSVATIVGGFATLVALYWAYITYYDWKKTHKNNEYDALIELGKAASLQLEATTYLFNMMIVNNLKFKNLSDLEHRLRDGKIKHSVILFERSIERYSDARAMMKLLLEPTCSELNYNELDCLVKEIDSWYWLLRYENIVAEMKPGDGDDKYTLYSAVRIPDDKATYMKHLELEGCMTSKEFYMAFSNKIKMNIQKQVNELSNN